MKTAAQRFDLSGRVAVVTGASSGLGVALSEGLAGAGARLVLAARRVDRLEARVADLAASGAEAIGVECDVSKEADVDALVERTVDHYGRADILINNAGISNVAPAVHETLDDFRRTLDINLTGAFLCAQRFGRVMVERGSGAIVNIASILGVIGVGLIPQAAYTASKGGLVNLTRELAAQWARKGVRVNAVGPGFFPSEMTDSMFADEKGQQFIRRHTPMGRGGIPDELVGPVLFLASDAASYVTGQFLAVDGGWTAV